jgi:glycosyltransferase involved in cell wall biosynthesis
VKVLIVNASDISGGAGRAAIRLHIALISAGIDSKMLVQKKISSEFTVIGPKTNIEKAIGLVRPMLDQLIVRFYKDRTKTLFSPSCLPFSNIIDQINYINPDIVHLHWICGGMMRIEDITKVKAPIVWSLHDNWAFTGGCHIMWDCDKYKDSCGACPRLGSKNENDLSRKIFNRKKKVFGKKKDMTIVGLSKWLNNCSKNSKLLKKKLHIHLPNPIDTHIFKPFGQDRSRELWRLPKDKKLILFGANSTTSDINKGFIELSEALQKLQDKNIELVIFGSGKPKKSQNFGFKTYYLGHLHDDVSLVTLYSAVDVMVVPSLQENLSNVIMESMACGTPVVGFNVGGNSDMIEHKINGYLATPLDTSDLKDGVEWVLKNNNCKEICQNAREKVVTEFDSSIVVEKYIHLYSEVINSKYQYNDIGHSKNN